jgi:circadian clock protein KaiB
MIDVTDPLSLLLFVRGQSARSTDAIRAVRQACNSQSNRSPLLRVIDVFTQPDLAERYGVIATPTLLTLGGRTERRIVGNMSEQALRHHLAESHGY